MSKQALRSVRGMNDLLPPESAKWRYFEAKACELFARYGYQEIRTPILEPTELFSRGIGEATDIVEKEMYTFPDRKNRSMTMRPEATASTVRAFIQHNLAKLEPISRFFYSGPMFRYERMQTGRYRQFYQIGVEAFGIAEPTIEAEQMAMLFELYHSLGLGGLSLLVNSVGNADDRPIYRQALVGYLQPHARELCADCQRRIETNPMRVLDCKVKTCKVVVADAPSVLDHLSDASKAHFDSACRVLSELGIPFAIDHRMVRGLDYYTGTVFELVSSSEELGTQSTLAAGGRYDSLVASLGGPDVPAVGFALGVERAILSLSGDTNAYSAKPVLFIASMGAPARLRAIAIAQSLRALGYFVDLEHREVGFKAQLKRAERVGAQLVAVLGDDEIARGSAKIRDMSTREESEIELDKFAEIVAAQAKTAQK